MRAERKNICHHAGAFGLNLWFPCCVCPVVLGQPSVTHQILWKQQYPIQKQHKYPKNRVEEQINQNQNMTHKHLKIIIYFGLPPLFSSTSNAKCVEAHGPTLSIYNCSHGASPPLHPPPPQKQPWHVNVQLPLERGQNSKKEWFPGCRIHKTFFLCMAILSHVS